jgi:transposase InsO family protein
VLPLRLRRIRGRRPRQPANRRQGIGTADAGNHGVQDGRYDNAMAETIIGLFKTEIIERRGPWRSVDAVEYATLEWVNWFNRRRVLEPLGYLPPFEFEQMDYRHEHPAEVAGLM